MQDARALSVPRYDFTIKILSRSTTGPVRYAWQEAYRSPDGKWNTLDRKGTLDFDPAYEFNDQSPTIGWIYPAYRDKITNQVLFF